MTTAASRSLLDRYGAGTASTLFHAGVVAALVVAFDPTPKPVAATIAVSMPMPAIEEVENAEPEATEMVSVSAPPPPEAKPLETTTEPTPPELQAQPPKPDDQPSPITTTAVNAPDAVSPPPETVVEAKEVPPPPQPVVHKPKPAPPAPRKPNPEPNTTEVSKLTDAPRAPAPPQAARSGGANAMSEFIGRVRARMQRNQTYPHEAQRRGEKGIAYLRFTIDRSGHVLAWRIDRSSGHELLDKEAADTLRRSDPLPQVPEDMPGQQIELVVPVQFMPR